MLEVGDYAPEFELPDQDGRVWTLRGERGSWVVVYFYPKDDTPGCTAEACAFRDALPVFEELDARIFGVSSDDQDSHAAFSSKFDLNFPLLADPDRQALEAYGVYGEKELAGAKYMGTHRNTFLVGPDGRIAHIWRKVDPAVHGDEVKAALEALRGGFA